MIIGCVDQVRTYHIGFLSSPIFLADLFACADSEIVSRGVVDKYLYLSLGY